jgi:hypothetical protein
MDLLVRIGIIQAQAHLTGAIVSDIQAFRSARTDKVWSAKKYPLASVV